MRHATNTTFSRNKIKNCTITQQLIDSPFSNWSDDERQFVINGDINGIMGVVLTKLKAAGYVLEEIHGAIHDGKKQRVWNHILQKYIYKTDIPHFHILCRFYSDENHACSGSLLQIADALDLQIDCFEKNTKNGFTYDDMLANLINAKNSEEIQYSPDIVATIRPAVINNVRLGCDYIDIYNESIKKWNKARNRIKTKLDFNVIDTLEEKIRNGEISKKDMLSNPDYALLYKHDSQKYLQAFKDRENQVQQKLINELNKKIINHEITQDEASSDPVYSKIFTHNKYKYKRLFAAVKEKQRHIDALQTVDVLFPFKKKKHLDMIAAADKMIEHIINDKEQ